MQAASQTAGKYKLWAQQTNTDVHQAIVCLLQTSIHYFDQFQVNFIHLVFRKKRKNESSLLLRGLTTDRKISLYATMSVKIETGLNDAERKEISRPPGILNYSVISLIF